MWILLLCNQISSHRYWLFWTVLPFYPAVPPDKHRISLFIYLVPVMCLRSARKFIVAAFLGVREWESTLKAKGVDAPNLPLFYLDGDLDQS